MMIPSARLKLRAYLRNSVAVFLSVSLVGCITLTTPEKPIEINLTINIRQEVLVKLERDVQNLIDKNPGVF